MLGKGPEREAAHGLREVAWAVGSAYAAYQRLEEGERDKRKLEYVAARDAFLTVARMGLLTA